LAVVGRVWSGTVALGEGAVVEVVATVVVVVAAVVDASAP
jgi:hypothetical protein